MPRPVSSRRRRPSVTPDPILPLSKLQTCEGDDAQQELTRLHQADQYAASIVSGGVLISGDHENVRLSDAVDDLSEKRCECRACEANMEIGSKREHAAYYVGLAVGLRLARAVDGPLMGGGQ